MRRRAVRIGQSLKRGVAARAAPARVWSPRHSSLMDDSTSHGPWTYPGDADAAAGGASDPFAREGDGYKDLEDLRAFDLRELTRRALEDAEGGL
jgi:hypothetical protein